MWTSTPKVVTLTGSNTLKSFKVHCFPVTKLGRAVATVGLFWERLETAYQKLQRLSHPTLINAYRTAMTRWAVFRPSLRQRAAQSEQPKPTFAADASVGSAVSMCRARSGHRRSDRHGTDWIGRPWWRCCLFLSDLSHGSPTFAEDQAVKVEGDVRERQLCLSAGKPDGANEERTAGLPMEEDVLDSGADRLRLRVCPRRVANTYAPAFIDAIDARRDDILTD